MIHIEKESYTQNGKHQPLPGFEEKYVNFVDYILKITDDIWHDRAMWVIYETYADDVLIHFGANEINGVEPVVKGTLETLSSFPDRHMGAEAVIWSADEEGKFFSSHRIFSEATNMGATPYGEATGKRVYFRTIADCAIKENKIYEEWLVRDNLHLVQQLGFDPVEMAKRDQRYKNGKAKSPEDAVQIAPDRSLLQTSPAAALIFGLFEKVWQKRAFDRVGDYYEDLARVHAICDEECVGHPQIVTYFENLANAFPEGRIIVERITCNERAKDTEVACRWKIVGTHAGEGFFGAPSGQEVVLPIISHYVVEDGKISQEWMVFDAFDALCQIHAAEEASDTLKYKKMVAAFLDEMNSNTDNSFTPIFKKYFADDIVVNITKPFEEIQGIESYENDFWTPLTTAFPDLENQSYILVGGEYEGRTYISFTGNLIGTFTKEWLGIPPNNQPTWLRYSATFLVEKDKVAKAWYFFDLLDVMRQAGFHFIPNRGVEIIPPAPMTGDGIVTYETDPAEGQKTLDLTNAMLDGLSDYDQKTLESMDQTRFWDIKNMMWYGPSGIGTTRGLKGFQDNHQVPFITAFPDRGITEKVEKDYFCQIGDGNYSCDFGFPAMYGTHLNDDWLGLKATGKKITLRVVDYWRREGDRLKENWVFIDLIDVLEQLGMDIFEQLQAAVQNRR